MAEDMFEAMDEDLDGMAAEEEVEDEVTGLDPEFLLHAEAAGFDGAKAEALKLAIERCVALKSEGSYDVEESAEVLAEDDEFA